MSEIKSSQEKALKQNEKIENHINNHEIPKNEVDSEDYDVEEEEEEYVPADRRKYVEVDLAKLKDLNCPICHGIIRKTKTIKQCLHRFCRECIDIYVNNGNKQCPVCCTHFLDKNSVLDDKDYDAIIVALYPRVVADEIGAGEEPHVAKKAIVAEKFDDDTASSH